jgi:uncharacterized Zn finger protein
MNHLDGNALAGPLLDVFAFDITAAVGRCVSCGTSGMIAESVVYSASPGFVARCPHCDAVLATVVESPDRVWLNLSGISALEISKR